MNRFFLLLPVLGCFDRGSEYHDDLLPTEDKIAINLPMGDAAKGTDTGTEWADYYVVTRQVTEGVNGIVTSILGTVGYVTTLQPSWTDESKTEALWGPYSDSGLDPVETGLWVRAEDDGSFTWALFAIERGGDIATDAIPLVYGVIDEGSTRDEASGQFYVDFTTANSLDPAWGLTGEWGVQYTYDALGVAGVVWADDYGIAGGQTVDAAYAYNQDWDGAGEMDLAWLTDIDLDGTEEVATLHSRWEADGQGRGDAQIGGGSLGSTVVSASECWNDDFARVYYADTADIEAKEGDEATCAFTPAEYATEASFALADG